MSSLAGLHFFCEHIVREYGSPAAATEDDKARAFRAVYLCTLPPNLRALKAIAWVCGINLTSLEGDRLPANLRGYHEVFNGRRSIYYRKNDSVSGIQNTILHEFREMMEPVLAELSPNYESLRTLALHRAANSFATAVLLPREDFAKGVRKTGFDVIALSKLYAKSCSQVLLRMGEVMHGRIFFYAALYEQVAGTESDWRVTYWTGSYNEDCPEANLHGAGRLFPKKGHPVIPSSPVDMAIKTGRTHFVEHIALLSGDTDDGLAAIAQPLALPEGRPGKVALVMMLKSDAQKLEPQIERTKPVVINRLPMFTTGKESRYEYGS